MSSSPEEHADHVAEAKVTARAAGLRYCSDTRPGIRRRASAHGVRYVHPDGSPVRDTAELRRLRSLAVPPAWTDVWICPDPTGHIQATGRDAKGRKQYRYHPHWREVRDETKYARMMAFGAALPTIRARVAHDLGRPGLPREKVIAAVVELLERTLIRIGNEEYARKNASFGLTTLRERHVTILGKHVTFHFRGKSGKHHVIDVSSPRLAAIVRRCQELPGQELFHFRDHEGNLHPIESDHVNAYLREASGEDFSAKDFRTWHGTLLAACELAARTAEGPPTKGRLLRAVEEVASRLGNTPTVCRKSYVHPAIVARYLRGELKGTLGSSICERETALLGLLKEEAKHGEKSLVAALEASIQRRAKGSRRRAA